MPPEAPIAAVHATAYTIPTDGPKSDGTLEWNATTLVVATVRAAGREGLGYTYADSATVTLIRDKLAPLLVGRDAPQDMARISSHCAPALHAALCCAAPYAVHLEWFHDHARIEEALFEGAPHVAHGMVSPDRTRPGLGLELRVGEAQRLCA